MAGDLKNEERQAIIKVLAAHNKDIQFDTNYLKYANQALTLVVIREGDTIILSTTTKNSN